MEVTLGGVCVSFWEGVSSAANELLICFLRRLYVYRIYIHMQIYIYITDAYIYAYSYEETHSECIT